MLISTTSRGNLEPVGGGTGVTSSGGTLGGVGATDSGSTLVVLVRVVTVLVGVGVDTTSLGLEFVEGDSGEGGHFVDN